MNEIVYYGLLALVFAPLLAVAGAFTLERFVSRGKSLAVQVAALAGVYLGVIVFSGAMIAFGVWMGAVEW